MATDCIIRVGPSQDTRLREAGAKVVCCLTRGAPKGPNLPRVRLNHQDALFPGHGLATHSQTWGNLALLVPHPYGIYLRELTAVCIAALLAPPQAVILNDNQALSALVEDRRSQEQAMQRQTSEFRDIMQAGHDRLATTLADAIARALHPQPGATAGPSGQPTTIPPVGQFSRFSITPTVPLPQNSTQATQSRPITSVYPDPSAPSDTWTTLAAAPTEFGINAVTQAALYGPPIHQQQQQPQQQFGQPPNVQAYYQQVERQPPACPPFQQAPPNRAQYPPPPPPPTVVTPAAYSEYPSNPQRSQRVFTLTDLPTRRDLAEAFAFVQSAARQTTNLGRRDIIELQLLEHYIEVWDCVCTGLSPRAKLRIFDRVRLLYHVAQGGWTTALEGYADPSATFLLGAPSTTRPSRPCRRDPSGGTPPRPTTRSTKGPTTPKKKEKSEVVSTTTFQPLPSGVPPPQECVDLLEQLDGLHGTLERLNYVVGPAQPAIAVVDGVPAVAVIQDLVLQQDLLAQALREVGIEEDIPLSTTPSPSTTSLSSPSTEEEDDDHTFAIGAERILRWLESHEIPDDSEDLDESEQDEEDSRSAAAHPSGPPFQPVRASLPPPKVDWDRLASTIGYYPPADPANLRIHCSKSMDAEA
ncbi:hypothetical protein HPB47_015285 [Ixodes persulcatus]|uniref:Uncharacterized protein n=1 Tax=Ixodes persulcatus TaxID=34615 RepID=A0AC60QTV4_IXOPE|nr:hypothetical protein HPB47_015285 [Ixodes persulcatus]